MSTEETLDGVSVETENPFERLVWLSSDEAARYLRKSPGALRVMVHRRQIFARHFRRRLFFKRRELDRLLETSIHGKG